MYMTKRFDYLLAGLLVSACVCAHEHAAALDDYSLAVKLKQLPLDDLISLTMQLLNHDCRAAEHFELSAKIGVMRSNAPIHPIDSSSSGSSLKSIPDVDNTTFAALQQLYNQNCGAACRASPACFPPQGVVRPVCGNPAWSFGVPGNPQCDADGHLKVLNICSCNLEGELAAQVADLLDLQVLCLSESRFNAHSLHVLSSLTNLNFLALANVGFTDTIPMWITALSSLTFLDLSENRLSGSIPVWLSQLSQLQSLLLTQNRFSGGIEVLTAITSLTYFNGAQNALSGSLPASLSQLSNFQSLYLSGNDLSGIIPAAYGNFPSLIGLELGQNRLHGPVPQAMSQLRALEVLTLSDNPIGGTVPDILFRLPALKQLYLSNASLVGEIPVALVTVANLTLLDLSSNSLSGTLPEFIAQASVLEVLLLSSNMFSGSIPNILLSNSFATLDLRNNALNGSLPSLNFFGVSQLLLDNNQLVGSVPFAATTAPVSVLSLANNNFDGAILSDSQCILSLASFANNSFAGPITNTLATCTNLRSLDVSGNAALFTLCDAQQAVTDPNGCLPSFLSIDSLNTIQQPGNIECLGVSGVGALSELQVTMDWQVYLHGAQCQCLESYFWPPSAGAHSSLQCVSCPAATNGASWCSCDHGSMKSCYAQQGASAGEWFALECPYIAAPYQTACALRSTNSTCTDVNSCQCAEGYTNRRCSQCVNGYYASGRTCSKCLPALQWLLPVIYAVVIVVFIVYLLKVPGTGTGALKVLFFYGQSLLLVVSNASIPWPQWVSNFLHSSSQTGSLSFTALECVVYGINETQRYAVYTLTPAVLVAICAVIFLVRRRADAADARNVFVYMALSVLLTTYFNVAVKMLNAVSCTLSDAADPSHNYLNAYPWIPCDAHSSAYAGVLGIGIVGLIVYVVGVPVLMLALLMRARHSLEHEAQKRQLGFVFGTYRPALYFWEAVLLLRRLVLAIALSMVPFTASQFAVIMIAVVLLLSILLQHSLQPFASTLDNRLEQLALYTLMITFLGVYVAQASANTPSPMTWLPVGLIILNLVTVVLIGVCVLLVLLASLMRHPLVQRVAARVGLPIVEFQARMEKARLTLSSPLVQDYQTLNVVTN
eukprot:TRINITY_DN3131_c0_g1_i1.p1 TRINITY_DN3131_c0_g1~~TRINITY_DN3131_c0_g1_i1.p1  ORF type:complete len:1113 (-),score=238.62 TRINITY_DN3131_c0_g1_i1:40-3378(-)